MHLNDSTISNRSGNSGGLKFALKERSLKKRKNSASLNTIFRLKYVFTNAELGKKLNEACHKIIVFYRSVLRLLSLISKRMRLSDREYGHDAIRI